MIYLVSKQRQLFDSTNYSLLSEEDAIKILKSWDRIQFDSETSGRDPHICTILCIQFGNKAADIQIVVDTSTIDILLFKDILESKLLIGHNLKFDISFLYKHSIIPSKIWDTMIIEQLLHLGYDNKYFHYSLKDVCERRLGIDIDKSTRGEIIWRGLDDKVILYAAGDVMYLEDIMEQQIEQCKKQTCTSAAKIENAFVPVIAYLEWCGIKLDINKWKMKMRDNEIKRDQALQQLNQWVVDYYKKQGLDNQGYITKYITIMEHPDGGDCKFFDYPDGIQITGDPIVKYENNCKYKLLPVKEFVPYVYINTQGDLFSGWDLEPKCSINWASSKQTIPFFQSLGFNTSIKDKKTGESKDSVVEKVLAKQKGIADDFLKLYFQYKEKFKDCSTYGQNYIDAINPNTGRIHTTFWQLGTISGRMSCGSKNNNTDLARLKGISPSRCKYVQCQNLPADEITRSSFISEPGNLFTSCDYSALESRLGADIYNDEAMLKEYLEGSGDIHSLVAKACFPNELEDVSVAEVKNIRPDLRKKAKAPEFACQFGGGPGAISDALGISKEEAKIIYNNYLAAFKGITEFKKRGSTFVRQNGYIVICKHTGHKIFWEDWKKWREIEDLPEYIYKQEYTSEERREHESAAAKWDRMALNSPTQGSGICILKIAMILFFNWIKNNNYFNIVLLCNLVHDESCIEYPEELKDIVVPMLVKCMETAAAQICKSLPIPAEPSTGIHWIH